jgi:hypothetical protein
MSDDRVTGGAGFSTARRVVFMPSFETIAEVRPTRTIAELEREQGVYSATPDFIRANCGPIANEILDAVPDWYFTEARARGLWPNIDVRVHRLYPGNVPAYPGYHCDANVRETYFGQPSPEHTPVSRHVTCSVSTEPEGVSLTEFLLEPVELTVSGDARSPTLWAQVDEQVRDARAVSVPDGRLTLFDSCTLHRASPARVRGWRLFFRLAMWYRPNLGQGQISRQEMVYLPAAPGSGW